MLGYLRHFLRGMPYALLVGPDQLLQLLDLSMSPGKARCWGRLGIRVNFYHFVPDGPSGTWREESSLDEVLVEGESSRQSPIAHDDKGDAVDQAPLLVGVAPVQLERRLEQLHDVVLVLLRLRLFLFPLLEPLLQRCKARCQSTCVFHSVPSC